MYALYRYDLRFDRRGEAVDEEEGGKGRGVCVCVAAGAVRVLCLEPST